MNRETLRDLTVFGLLLTLGVVGRWAQPEWNFTPLVAVTALGGFYFRQTIAAVCLPIGVLALSDLLLPPHNSWPVLVSVHVMMFVPLCLGRLARHAKGKRRLTWWIACGFAPATAFFVVTNFAVWAFTGLYENTWAGLLASYAAGIPFYRTMLAGDIFYLSVLLSVFALAEAMSRRAVVEQA